MNKNVAKLFKKITIKSVVLVIILLLPIASCFLCGFVYSFNPESKREASIACISQESQLNIDNKSFLKIYTTDIEKGENNSRSMYLRTWRDNFVYNTEFLCSSKEDSYEPEEFSLSNKSFNADSVTLIDACNYSSQKELLRFETLKMNIYTYRDRQNETYTGNCDGFIYIPDFYADKIIESSNGLFRYYEDLIPNGAISQILDEYLVIKVSNNDRTYRFRIANIFHVSGYNKNYFKDGPDCNSHVINDSNTGEKMALFIGDFCVCYCYKMIKENNYCLAGCLDSKQYSLIDFLNVISSNGANSINGNFYKVNQSEVSLISDSNTILDNWNNNGFDNGWINFFSIFAYILPFLILFLSYYTCKKLKFSVKKTVTFFIIQSFLLILLEIIVTLTNRFVSPYSFIHILFSKFFGINALILIICLILSITFTLKYRKDRKHV